jgi:fumarate hydratase, class II
MATDVASTRVERDSMGELPVPADAYYGASTQRAVLNFPISTARFGRRLVRAIGLIKRAAAEANHDLGLLDSRVSDAIVRAADEVIEGKLDDQFVVDVYQTGSGTSTNMNANEVIANRAAELLGGRKGDRSLVHPNDHVNMGQSSNDVFPTSMQLAALDGIEHDLIPALQHLQTACEEKSRELWDVVKTGRTHLQDATPIRLGQEFLGYAGQAERAVRRLRFAQDELREVPLGGTAVGTGINMHPELAGRVCTRVNKLTGLGIYETPNHFQAQSTIDAVVVASSVLSAIAASMMKVANDIRWLASGPRAGLGEIDLPEVQPGSSIMPGKVNPVIAEALTMVCSQVIGNGVTVTLAGQSGNFELNVQQTVAAHNLTESIVLLGRAVDNFVTQCVVGIRATENGPRLVETGLAIGTALAPVIGYDKAAAIAKHAAQSGRTIREVARDETALSDSELDEILDPARMTEPGFSGASAGG